MALLGEDGRGYELARKLDTCGVWRTWLGDTTYPNFAPFLSSPSAWESFITSTTHIILQLRVRALLFDKAVASLSPNPSLQRLNPTFLQLHPDDIYFTLDTSPDTSKNQNKSSSSSTGSRYVESELPETWYSQVIDKYKANKSLAPRSPAEMASYLNYVSSYKRRRLAFKEDRRDVNSVTESNGGNLVGDDDCVVFPEVAFAFNCVPESAISVSDGVESGNGQKVVKVFSVLDTLPPVRSSVVIERFGVRPENVGVEHGGGVGRGKFASEGNGKVIGPEQAAKLAQKAVARILLGVGFDGAMEGSVEDFSEVLSERICKIGTNLRVLADSYRKQCSAIELLKMLLKTLGFSNFAPLVDVVKDGSKNVIQQSQQQVHGMQPQMQQQQQQSSLRLSQQIQMQRQMHPQMQQMIHSQNMAFQQQQHHHQQQQLERMRRRTAASTPRPAMDMDKERPLVQVKIENQDLPIDSNAFTSRHPQMQFRQQQQQMAGMSNFHSQPGTPFRQMSSLQIPSMQTQNISMVRAPPVKVEGFSELMGGGDSTAKHDLEENRLTSPNGK